MWSFVQRLRPYFTVGLLLLVLLAPWWWPVLLGLIGLMIYPKFYGLLWPALLLDLLYGGSGNNWWGWQFPAAAAVLILTLTMTGVRRYINW